MIVFYATFGQGSALRNGWIEITAATEHIARQEASRYPNWCGLYYNPDNPIKEEYFPDGCLGRITV